MRASHFITLGLFALIGGCSHLQGGGERADAMTWTLHATREEGVKLAYGQPNSDNVVVMMACQPRSQNVRLSAPAPAGAPPQVTLVSRGERQLLSGQLGPAGGAGGQLVEVAVPTNSKPLQGFASGGELSLVMGETSTKVNADRRARAAVSTFFATCKAAA
ncbi:MAG: hypothetical protein IT546_06880 [Caulobacteraceae bacterium]|nr:hypothetical protein [Caulobacteraceae bacterium]